MSLKLGMVGGGKGAFIGGVHRIAARLDGQWELVAGAFSMAGGEYVSVSTQRDTEQAAVARIGDAERKIRRISGEKFFALFCEDAGERQFSSRTYVRADRRCQRQERVGEDVGYHNIKLPLYFLSRIDEASANIVAFCIVCRRNNGL